MKVGGAQTPRRYTVNDNKGKVKYLQVIHGGMIQVAVFSKESDYVPEKTMSFLIPNPIVKEKLVSDHFILNGLTITMKPTDYKGRQPKEHDYEFENKDDVKSFLIEISKAYVPIRLVSGDLTDKQWELLTGSVGPNAMAAAAVAARTRTPSLKKVEVKEKLKGNLNTTEINPLSIDISPLE